MLNRTPPVPRMQFHTSRSTHGPAFLIGGTQDHGNHFLHPTARVSQPGRDGGMFPDRQTRRRVNVTQVPHLLQHQTHGLRPGGSRPAAPIGAGSPGAHGHPQRPGALRRASVLRPMALGSPAIADGVFGSTRPSDPEQGTTWWRGARCCAGATGPCDIASPPRTTTSGSRGRATAGCSPPHRVEPMIDHTIPPCPAPSPPIDPASPVSRALSIRPRQLADVAFGLRLFGASSLEDAEPRGRRRHLSLRQRHHPTCPHTL